MSLPVWADVAEEADRAWAAGDHETALSRYDRVLEQQPDNFLALIRTAKILSWQSRFRESIDRYDRAIAVDPGDREARLGRAATLSWAGRYKDARGGFRALLDEDSTDVDALLGLARTYAWAARTPQARDAYQSVLDTDPENVDARVGLAYLDLWSGEIGNAARRSSELREQYPKHDEVAKLHASVSRSAGAWWSVDTGWLDDTDDNRLRRYFVSGGMGLGRQVRLDLGAGRDDMSGPTGDATIDHVHATLSFFPKRGHRASATAGYDRRTGTDDATTGDVLGGLSYSWRLDRRWQLHASARRMPIRYSAEITDNGITFDQLELRTDAAVGERFRVHAGLGAAEFSDENSRLIVNAGVLYRVPLRRVTMQVGYALRAMDYDLDLANGYFDPQDFVAHLAQLRVHDEYGKRGNYYRLHLETGVQSFTIGGIDVSDDRVLVVGATFGFPVAKRMIFEAYAEHGDYAAVTAGGFESTTAGLRLRWRAGL